MKDIRMNVFNRILLGFAIGDALGVPFEFRPSEYCRKYYTGKYTSGVHDQQPGTWSDDTSMLLCVARSKNVCEYKNNLKRWRGNDSQFNCFNLFDIGNGVKTAIDGNFKLESKDFKGNGCLSVAIGCFVSQKHNFEDYVRVTHDNVESVGSAKKIIDILTKLVNNPEFNPKFSGGFKNNGYCEDSLNLSIKCFNNAVGYKDCIKKAIHFGGDTDSNAAITGAIAALRHKIPIKLINELKNRHKLWVI